ncbi:UNVERIFIED_CONTAM: hypothetical protein GTU68_002029 [Idotea baltica]|nr:hypothetical protein [Idotea baltica]
MDDNGDENFKLYSVNIHNGEQLCLTPFDKVTTQIIDELENDDNCMLIALNKRNKQIFDVYKLNIETGEIELIFENPGNVSAYITDHTGVIRILHTTDGVAQTYLYRANETDEFKSVIQLNFKDALNLSFFDFDNNLMYASSNLGRDKQAIVLIDPATMEEKEVIFSHEEVDVKSISYSKKRKTITSTSFVTWKKFYHFYDKQVEKQFADIQNQVGEEFEISIVSTDKDETKYIIRTYSDRSLGCYYLYDVADKQLYELAEVSPWIKPENLGEMKAISYTSRDNLKINGYLTIPKGRVAKDLPIVINPHGGPWHRDTWGYNPEVQFLCNRGYAVFQMNFRGSTGYGREFWQSSFKEWGKAMQDDITDGVNWLVEEGIANPKKIAIYGGSYGGYATLAGAAFTPDLYACAIDFVGVSNLFSFLETIPPYWKPYLDMMYEMVGHPESDKELLESSSPVFHVDKIKCPLMVVQGAKDPRVKQAESDQIVEALKNRGVDVEYMLKENEGHGFRNEENKFEFYQAMEDFLQKHLC